MAYSYDPDTDVGTVRLLANDNDEATHLFEDNEIDRFLALESGTLRAAALALTVTAGNETLVQKKVSFLAGAGITTDGPAVAKALLDQAKVLRERADSAELEDDEDAIDIAEMAFDPFSTRDIVYNGWLREVG